MKLKRLLSVMLSCVMALQFLPTSALANESAAQETQSVYPITITGGQANSIDEMGTIEYNVSQAAALQTIQLVNGSDAVLEGWDVKTTSGQMIDVMYKEDLNCWEFTMPEEGVVVEAIVEKVFSLSSSNHNISMNVMENGSPIQTGVTSAKPGQEIQVIYTAGNAVSGWNVTSDGNPVEVKENQNDGTVTFVMPEGDVTVEPLLQQNTKVVKHTVTVKNALVSIDDVTYVNSLSCEPGQHIYLKYDRENAGRKCFVQWKVNKGNISFGDGEIDGFEMPDEDVEIEAVVEAGYLVHIINGTVLRDGVECSSFYALPGEMVSVEEIKKEGYVFDHWNILKGNIQLLTAPYDPNHFYMPSEDVELEAVYAKSYKLTWENRSMSDEYAAGDKVVLHSPYLPDRPETSVFSHYEVVSGNVELHGSQYENKCWFIMPEYDVVVRAVYQTGYSLEVDGQVTYVKANTTQHLKTNGDNEGVKFTTWKCDNPNVQLRNATSYTDCTFVMPAENVKIYSVYDKKGHSIVAPDSYVSNLYNQTGDYGIQSALPGDYIAVNNSPDQNGLIFDHFEVVKGNVQLEYNESGYSCYSTAYFVMPDEDVELKPVYTTARLVKVINGLADYHKWYNSEVGRGYGFPSRKGQKVYLWSLVPLKNWKITCDLPVEIHKEPENNIYSFIVPDADVTIEAIEGEGYRVDIDTGDYYSDFSKYNCDFYNGFLKGYQFQLPVFKGTAPVGKEFDAWVIDGKKYQPNDLYTVNKDTVITCVYKEKDTSQYPKLNVYGLKYSVNYQGNHSIQESTVKPGSVIELYTFTSSGYMSEPANYKVRCLQDDVVIKKNSIGRYYFIMPDHEVTIFAEYPKQNTLYYDVNGLIPEAYENIVHSVSFSESDSNKTLILQDVDEVCQNGMVGPNGEAFLGWEYNGKIYQPGEGIVVDKDIVMKAVWQVKTEHVVTVHQGKADTTKAKMGQSVTIIADYMQGYVFDHWQVNKGNVVLEQSNNSTTQFIMLNEDVEVSAVYTKINPGWNYNDGWMYVHADGSYSKNKFEKIGLDWYYFDAKGHYVTGWKEVNGQWFYFYYKDGHMAHDEWIEESYLSSNGVWISVGWQLTVNGWQYIHKNGSCTQNAFEQIEGQWYYFDANGCYVKGWKEVNGQWFYFYYKDGHMAHDEWIEESYLSSNGVWIQIGWQYDGSGWSYVHKNGSCTKGAFEQIKGQWYYFDKNGHYVTGWHQIAGTWYFFYYNDGHMAHDEVIDGNTLDSSGAWIR